MSSQPPRIGQQIILPDGVRVDIKTEENPDDARHRRWQQTGLFVAALLMFGVTFFVTMWFAFFATGKDELQKSAVGIFVTLAGALGGFLGGRATK